MIGNVFTLFFSIFPGLKGEMWKQAYQALSGSYRGKDWKFINYGYASIDPLSDGIPLDEGDEAERYSLQLYHHVAGAVELEGRHVLEVGCGRGGGADYIRRYLMPATITGVDYSENAVDFCCQTYAAEGLSFKTGKAESLPFGDGSFDIVINVESSHCYDSADLFFGEANRVLREGGYLLYADFHAEPEVKGLRERLLGSGWRLAGETDITANVVEALRRDSDRRRTAIQEKIGHYLRMKTGDGTVGIKKRIHKQLVDLMSEFSGVSGSRIFKEFQNGNTRYLSFVLQKRSTDPER